MNTLFFHLRNAARSLLRTPGFTLMVLFTLALGIGANSAMFSVTRALLLKPLPFPEPDRLVALWGRNTEQGLFRKEVSAPNFFDWRDEVQGFEGMALFADEPMDLAGPGEAEGIHGLSVTSGYFELLGARPLLGRTFTREDEAPGAPPVALLSHGLWQRRFGGDPAVVGRTLSLGGRATLVVGVLPAAFRAPTAAGQEVFTAFPHDPKGENRGMNVYGALGRLRPGVSLAQAGAELDAVALGVLQRHPDLQQGWSTAVVDFRRALTRETARPLLLLQGAVLLLLLIACANLANLLLMRGAARLREVAVRDALGASLRHHLAQHGAEGLVLSLAGALAGLLLARAALGMLPALWAQTNALGALRAPSLDGGVLAFTFALALLVSLIFGLVPLLQLRRGRSQLLLQREARHAPAMVRLRKLLVLAEVALATVLVLGSGLLLRSFFAVAGTPPGFDAGRVIAFRLSLPESAYPGDAPVSAFNRELIQRLEGLPGVEGATACGFPPLSRTEWNTPIHLGPTDLPSGRWTEHALANLAGPGYLQVLGIPLLQGRGFSRAEGPHPRAIVNAAFVRAMIPSGEALGRRFQIGLTSGGAPEGTLFEIVGVMGDQRATALEKAPEPSVLLSMEHLPFSEAWYLVRTRQPIGTLAEALRAQVAALDRHLALRDLTTLATLVDQNLGNRRQPLLLLGTFAALALLLSVLGIHGVVAFSVAERTREIGLRAALGATAGAILRMVFRQGMTPVALGILAGLGAFAALNRFLASQLYGIQSSDPLTVLLTLGLLSLAAIFACLLPALRAARVQPSLALRSE